MKLIRDPSDVVILAGALTVEPDTILTDDKDLLTDKIRAKAPVCYCAEYLAKWESTERTTED